MNCELILTYDTPALRQTGSRALTTADRRPPSWNQITDKRHVPPLMKRGG
jgi:hypothetical protein